MTWSVFFCRDFTLKGSISNFLDTEFVTELSSSVNRLLLSLRWVYGKKLRYCMK